MKSYRKSQSLAELAIFGTIILMLLGTLINYAVRFNAQQKTMQHAFRRALAQASGSRHSGAISLVRDVHVPSPQDPFGKGYVEQLSGSGQALRSHLLHLVPVNVEALPRTLPYFQGTTLNLYDCPSEGGGCTTSGYRTEYDITPEQLKKYNEIFGEANINSTCTEYQQICTTNPETGEQECEDGECLKYELIITDPNIGELVSYTTAVQYCRMIVNRRACQRECIKYDPNKDCSFCDQTMNPPNEDDPSYDPTRGGAWYCQGYYIDEATNRHVFPILKQMFAFAYEDSSGSPIRPKAMGVQPEAYSTKSVNNQLSLSQSSGNITETNDYDWDLTTYRDFIYHPYGDEDGSYVNDEDLPNSVQQIWTGYQLGDVTEYWRSR